MNVNYLNIAKNLLLEKDDTLLITGDVRFLANKERANGNKFDVQAFINSFKEQLPEGTLLFYAFNDDLISGDTFNYKKSKPNTGSLSTSAWKDSDFIRTKDPFHSFMAWGVHANDLEQIDSASTFGNDSVFAWLHQKKAKMLIIDVPFVRSFTYVHYCEEQIKVPYRKYIKHRINYVDENGREYQKEVLFFSKKTGYDTYLDNLEIAFENKGIAKVYHFNNSTIKLVHLNEAFDYTKEIISDKKFSLLRKFSYKKWMKDILRKYYRKIFPRKSIS